MTQKMKPLSEREKRLVEEYLVDLNIKQAALRAGFSKKNPSAVGSIHLKKPNVQAALTEARQRLTDRTHITQDRVLNELAKIGFADIRKVVAWGANPEQPVNLPPGVVAQQPATGEGGRKYPVELLPSEMLDDDTAAAISEVSLTKQGVKVKMYDKRAALVDIGRHLGMFSQDAPKGAKVTVTPNGSEGDTTKFEIEFVTPENNDDQTT